MRFYDDVNEEDEFTEEEISLAKGFCDACDKGILMDYDEDQYDVIISHLMFSQKGDYLKKAIERARKEFPEDPEFVIWQARYYIWNNQIDEAQLFMQKTLRRFPPSAVLYEELAFIAYTFRLNLNVRELVSKAISIEPSSNAYFILTNLYLDKNNVPKAFDCFMEAYRYDNGVIYNLDLLIQTHNMQRSDRFDAELAFAEMLCREFPLIKQIWMVTGSLYAINGQHPEALQCFEFANSIEPEALLYFAIAQENCHLGDYQKTLDYCQLASQISDENTANVLMGRALRKMHRYEDSLLHILKADEKDIDFPFAFSELVETLSAMGRMDEIPDFIDRFYKAENLTLEKLEWVLDCLSLDRPDGIEFQQLCLSAANQFQNDTDYCAWLTEFCYLVHTPKTALHILETHYTDSPDSELYLHLGYFLALLHIADNDPVNAIHHLQNALIINENGISEDFLEIDSEKLYEQYPDIYYIVSPYLDRISDVRNN
ncbi:MAG: hypothetical protein J6X98_00335 [Bacteroidales bacterium]|nr:hypothetical protein [Bacteroidales bacterium]